MAKTARFFQPPQHVGLYEKHESLRVWRITSLKRHYEQSRRVRRRHNFKQYRIRKIARLLNGTTVWLVYGNRIRGTKKHPGVDVDFTMGGHGHTHLYIPAGRRPEIWIDNNLPREEVWPTIWHEYLESGLMREGIHYNSAHAEASRLEITLREGTYFVLPVGTYHQKEDGYCAPAALKIYLKYLGRNFSETYLARLCKTTVEKGTDPPNIMTAVRRLGFRVHHRGRPLTLQEIRRYCRATGTKGAELKELITKVRGQASTVRVHQPWTVAEVKKSLKRGWPVLANIQLSREYRSGHYVVIVGYTHGSFIVSDPNDDDGFREIPIPEFVNLWYELEDGTVHEGFTFSI